jgi:hypothetical protein
VNDRAREAGIAAALDRNLTSPNETDSNFEPANLVDAVFFLARQVRRAAESQATCSETNTRIDLVEALYIIGKAGERIAEAIREVAGALAAAKAADRSVEESSS